MPVELGLADLAYEVEGSTIAALTELHEARSRTGEFQGWARFRLATDGRVLRVRSDAITTIIHLDSDEVGEEGE